METNLTEVFKNCGLTTEMIFQKYLTDEINKEEANEWIRVLNEEREELEDGEGWFDINSAKIYKIEGNEEDYKNNVIWFPNMLLKTRKGTIIYKYFTNFENHNNNNNNIMGYKYRIASAEDVKLFEDFPVYKEKITYSDKEV